MGGTGIQQNYGTAIGRLPGSPYVRGAPDLRARSNITAAAPAATRTKLEGSGASPTKSAKGVSCAPLNQRADMLDEEAEKDRNTIGADAEVMTSD